MLSYSDGYNNSCVSTNIKANWSPTSIFLLRQPYAYDETALSHRAKQTNFKQYIVDTNVFCHTRTRTASLKQQQKLTKTYMARIQPRNSVTRTLYLTKSSVLWIRDSNIKVSYFIKKTYAQRRGGTRSMPASPSEANS